MSQMTLRHNESAILRSGIKSAEAVLIDLDKIRALSSAAHMLMCSLKKHTEIYEEGVVAISLLEQIESHAIEALQHSEALLSIEVDQKNEVPYHGNTPVPE